MEKVVDVHPREPRSILFKICIAEGSSTVLVRKVDSSRFPPVPLDVSFALNHFAAVVTYRERAKPAWFHPHLNHLVSPLSDVTAVSQFPGAAAVSTLVRPVSTQDGRESVTFNQRYLEVVSVTRGDFSGLLDAFTAGY